MKYEIAKRLKDAEFPQLNGIFFQNNGQFDGEVFYPTLSELIEEFGDRFRRLIFKPKYGWDAEARGITREDGSKAKDIKVHNLPTPEEAVANLWLALNSSKEE